MNGVHADAILQVVGHFLPIALWLLMKQQTVHSNESLLFIYYSIRLFGGRLFLLRGDHR